MKVAIAYDWLNQKSGGGEDALFEILSLYPKADLFCLVYNKQKFASKLGDRVIKTSRLQKFPNFMKRRPELFLPFIIKAVDKLDFTGYDLVISVSSAWVKNIKTPKNCTHISYCFSPARMIWDSWPKYLINKKLGPFKVGPIQRFFITKIVSKIRLWDFYSTEGVDEFVAISRYIQKRIKKYYHRDSKLVYPPVDITSLTQKVDVKKEKYFVIVSVLSEYKNIQLAVRAFKNNGYKLLVAGDGPYKEELELMAKNSPNIEFLGRVSEEKKQELLSKAKAFIFCSIEDFGIAPVEAIAAGTPVIGPAVGGIAETITNNKTGTLYSKFTVEDLNSAIERFNKTNFKRSVLQSSAEKYSKDSFDKNFTKTVSEIVKLKGAK